MSFKFKFCCDTCKFKTDFASYYARHVATKRHKLLCSTDTSSMLECKHCKTKYKTRSGLWQHYKQCSAPVSVTEPLNVLVASDNSVQLLEQIKELNDRLATHTLASTVNNNTTNNQHFHVYLNTHCKNALNIDQFIANATFLPEDFDVFFKKQFYDGALTLINKQLAALSETERPMHCINPVVNKPKTFFIKNDDKWKEETQGDFVYQMKCIDEWQNEDEKMLLTQFFQGYNDKMWDSWQKLCENDPRYNRLIDRMRRVTNSDDKMSILDDLDKEGNLLSHYENPESTA